MSHRASQFSGVIRSVIARMALQIPPTIAQAVSVTDVRVSSDLSYADVFVTAIGSVEGAIKALQAQKPAMRRELASLLMSHRLPVFRFHVDRESERASRLDDLLRSL